MTRPRDPVAWLWGLLGLWIGIELLASSRWWPADPGRVDRSRSPAAAGAPLLRDLLGRAASPDASAPLPVWFAPYLTFPETGLIESTARSGVYDTVLAIPARGITSNYGAFRLSAADTLFSLASAYGLASELRLARRLSYGLYALDLGAVTDPQQASQLCRATPGCLLSGDGYALFPISAGPGRLERDLARLRRRISLLPQKSAGASWGPVLFAPQQWGVSAMRAGSAESGGPWLIVQPLPRTGLEIYRHPLERYPLPLRPLLRLSDADAQLVLTADVFAAQICIGAVGSPCTPLRLGPGRRQLAIGELLIPGRRTRLTIQSLLRRPGGTGLFQVELRAPAAARVLMEEG